MSVPSETEGLAEHIKHLEVVGESRSQRILLALLVFHHLGHVSVPLLIEYFSHQLFVHVNIECVFAAKRE